MPTNLKDFRLPSPTVLMNLNNSILPVFIIADTFNRVVFVSQGYTIGLGEQLMKVVHGL